MSIFLYILAVVVLVLLVVVAIPLIIGALLSEKGYNGPVSAHFDGKKFRNEKRSPVDSTRSGIKYGVKRNPEKGIFGYETYVRSEPLPQASNHEIHVTYVNHSTFLLQVGGLNILTDPIWSKRCSPVQWAGPARYRLPGVRIEDLPPIDLILLSHNHYDHLDLPTLRSLKNHDASIITPLGVSHMLKKRGFDDIHEMDWWNKHGFRSLVISAVPANHFSARGTLDRNRTLWCGYVIQYKDFKLYFVGDTGYGTIFKKIGVHFGGMDLSLIPIGAYMPRWFMAPVHIDPTEALQVHLDVQSKKSIAMHFGTFPLADDGPTTAPKELARALEVSEVRDEDFIVPDEGHTYAYNISS